jgi:hypothetical protein
MYVALLVWVKWVGDLTRFGDDGGPSTGTDDETVDARLRTIPGTGQGNG